MQVLWMFMGVLWMCMDDFMDVFMDVLWRLIPPKKRINMDEK